MTVPIQYVLWQNTDKTKLVPIKSVLQVTVTSHKVFYENDQDIISVLRSLMSKNQY